MRTLRHPHLSVMLLAITALVPIPAPARSGAQVATPLAEEIDGFVRRYVDAGLFSGVALVARRDTVLFERAYGYADREHRVPNTPDTRFPVASVSKAFTAVAAARMYDAGRIRPEEPLSRYLPEYPRADEITVGQLVRHRAGIPDIDDLAWFPLGQRVRHSLDELVDSLARTPLDFEPGTRQRYSNGGYILLAAVLERAAATPFGKLLERYVFEPAGMSRSGNWDGGVVPGRAEGYTLGPGGGLVPAPYVHPSNKIGAGAAYTTARDVLAFHRGLRDGTLIRPAVRDSLFRPIESPVGRPRVYFGGRAPGYIASIQRFVRDDVLVVLLGNTYVRVNEEISDGIAGLMFGRPEHPRLTAIYGRELPIRAIDLAERRLRELAGRYRHAWGFTFTLRHRDGRLIYQDPEHGTLTPVLPTSDSTFVALWQWAELRFPLPERSAEGSAGDGHEPGIEWIWLEFPDQVWQVERR